MLSRVEAHLALAAGDWDAARRALAALRRGGGRSGMGEAAYHEGRWGVAMREYTLARDQLGYSLAFHEHRQELLRSKMGWLVGGVLVVMAGVVSWPIRPLVKKETPQLCWGGTQSLTVPEVS